MTLDQPLPGQPVTFTLIFGNDGSTETGIVVSDVLPLGVDYAWSTPAGVYDPLAHELHWDGLVLEGGARVTATVGVTVGEGVEPGSWMTNTSYLLWRDEVHSDWARLQVGREPDLYLYLPLVARDGSGP